jgi:hypothetical protein
MAHAGNGRNPDPGTRLILEELRDLRVEMRADRAAARAEMRADRTEMRADRKKWDEERRRSDERFENMMRAFREDSMRREAATQKAFREIRTVGLAIVKTLNRHTKILEHISEHHGRLLERIDRKLGARDDGRPDQGNGRGA